MNAKCALDAILKSGDTLMLGALRTTIDGPILFDTVSDYSALAMRTNRCQSVDGTLKRIKSVLATGHHHGKGLVVIVSTDVAGSHGWILLFGRSVLQVGRTGFGRKSHSKSDVNLLLNSP